VSCCLRSACVLGAAALCSACGGGGDDNSGVVAPAVDFDAFSAWAELLSGDRSWTVSGVGSDGRHYVITIATAAPVTSIFPVTGTTAARADTQITTDADGAVATGTQQAYFDGATLRIVGLRTSIAGSAAACDVATVTDLPPAAVRVNTTGVLATLDELDGCAGSSQKIGTIELTWSLEFEAGITYFCSNSTERDLAGNAVSFEGDCVQTSPDGSLGTAARVTVQQNGVTVVAR